MKKISIIVPVFNSEKTIERCMDSLLNQTLEQIEIILIEDCSTDGSKKLVSYYAEKSPDKVKFILHTENMRQGVARNHGFTIATRKYILFVDSDDEIETDACQVLSNCAEKENADIVIGNYDLVYSNKKEHVNVYEKCYDGLGKMTKVKRETLLRQKGYFGCELYRAGFLKETYSDEVLFPEQVYYEDSTFNTLSTLSVKNICKVEHTFYHYYQNEQSTVRKARNQLDKIKVAEYLDIIYYKAATLCGVALLYGCIPLIESNEDDIRQYIDKIGTLVALLSGRVCLMKTCKDLWKSVVNILNTTKWNYNSMLLSIELA